ncbi:MAG TPA: OmpA family protein [Bacteroidales bacterium]|nr:OmpA family protein [Bacteroidales bacterium]
MIRYILFFILILLFFYQSDVSSQEKNLVLNPGFEKYDRCPEDYTPENLSHKLVPGWTYPTRATPDYFNRCSPRNVGVPRNFAGESEAHGGDGYAGAILSGTEESYREYIQGTLSVPMVKGNQYCIKFYYRLASYSRFAVDQMSIYFSPTEIKNDININLSYAPQITNKVGLFLDNIDEWEQFCTVYTATGSERFFIIGNFRNYDQTNYVVTDKNVVNLRNKAYAYYYFDDVSISPLDNCLNCPCVLHDFESRVIETRYTGGKDPMTGRVSRIVNDGAIRIGLIGGVQPYTVTWNNNMTGTELRNLPAGTFIYVARDRNNCLSSDTVIFTEPVIEKDDFLEGLKAIEEGSAIVLENIFFEFNKTELLPASYNELNKVVQFMLEEDIKKIEIAGHTDSEGSDSYNQKLSEGRAAAVVNYLASQGIDPERMIAVGYGETRPIDTNTTDQGKAQNRRVEFVLVKK